MKGEIIHLRGFFLASFLLVQLTAGQDEALLAFEAAEEATPSVPPEFTCSVKVQETIRLTSKFFNGFYLVGAGCPCSGLP